MVRSVVPEEGFDNVVIRETRMRTGRYRKSGVLSVSFSSVQYGDVARGYRRVE